MKGAFDRSYSGIRLYLKFLLQISSRVIFDHVNVTYKFIKLKFNFNLAEVLCIFSIVHAQAQTSIAKYQFVSSGLLVSLSSALTIG